MRPSKHLWWQKCRRNYSVVFGRCMRGRDAKNSGSGGANSSWAAASKGNLAAQVLAFQWDLAAACELTSLRISRIANCSRHGDKKRWVSNWVHALQKTTVDFLSGCFGYHPKLWAFWQKCGFVLAHIGDHQEASSGHYAAIALYPLTAAGDDFCQKWLQGNFNVIWRYHFIRWRRHGILPLLIGRCRRKIGDICKTLPIFTAL